MISYLQGTIKDITGSILTVLTESGVGYSVRFVSDHIGFIVGESVELYIFTHVREQELSLFGFENKKELEMFEMLISISGIGPKAAQAILAKHKAKGVVGAILNSNADGLRVSGVGLKTAEKIVLELKDKLMKLGYSTDETGEQVVNLDQISDKLYTEVEQALVSLGLSRNEVKSLVSDIHKDNPDLDTVEGFVREGLKRM